MSQSMKPDTKTLADKPQAQLFEMIDRLARETVQTGAEQALSRYAFEAACFLSESELRQRVAALKHLSSEEYHQQIIAPLETGDRGSVIKLVHALAEEVHQEFKQGPLYTAEVTVVSEDGPVRCGIIAQNRLENKGVWMPEHHRQAGEWARRMEQLRLPIVTFIDTPGADAGALANQQNQAHSISALIATMADLTVPTVGIVLGAGYSGGAIPLATTNVLLSVRDGLFNTIQPQGLAAIARKQKLDWKSCAQLVGVSACELQQEGVIDGVIDYSPVKADRTVRRLRQAIFVAVQEIQHRARTLVGQEPSLATFYQLDALRLTAAEGDNLRHLQPRSVQDFPSLFGIAFRALRSLTLRSRIKVAQDTQEQHLDEEFLPVQAEQNIGESLTAQRFREWLERKDRLVYEEDLYRCWQRYLDAAEQLDEERGYLASLLFGEPKDNYDKALNELGAEIAFSLYNRWQRDVQENLRALIQYLSQQEENIDASQIVRDQVTLMDILRDARFSPLILEHCRQLKQFDVVYEKLLAQLVRFVSELSDRKKLSAAFVEGLLDEAGLPQGEAREAFSRWLASVKRAAGFRDFLHTAEQWKKQQHPRLSTVAFVVASYVFDKLLPEFFLAQRDQKTFSGHFQPVSIGRRKDFWNQLQQATIDLRIQEVLNQAKPAGLFQPQELLARFFSDFQEQDSELTSANPRRFPGFGSTLSKQRERQLPTAGLLTGTAKVNGQKVGVFISNHAFQAGAFDMASAERLCRLLAHCGRKGLPVIGFVCSGGMQTKEGASALFSMAVVNDHINRFVMELQLPLMIIGYGDCTGGAQASLVTHPLVDTYYFSGTNMPFAGRIVVPDYLPVTSTLSNYLVKKPGAMQGLVKHPFMEELDSQLRAIDPKIDVATVTVEELIDNWLQGRVQWSGIQAKAAEAETGELLPLNIRPFEKVLVHARGCTAVKLIREAQAMNLKVVLVQSDPDMDSVAAESLSENDQLVCLGGYTSEESYLNGDSVLRIAEITGAEALHPGIGFLSENHGFAQDCLAQDLVFVGPAPASMSSMGDKAQAIHTAMAAGVPVVPGSHGVLRDVAHAHEVADRIGYPVILKAAHGGGGKGILEVLRREDLEESFLRIQAEGRNSFGRDEIYLERLVTRFRHIEVQVLRDKFGCTQILGIRDCSVQRNKQKILEESASTLLSPEQERVARVSAAKLAEACDYMGAGTVEFIFDLDHQQLYFMEMNTRLQVEHPVTELVSGIDIVREQFRIAMGKSIDHLQPSQKGYAIEARVNAERVSVDREGRLQVAPTSGLVTRCEFPEQEGITQILCVGEGKAVPPFYDNLIAQIIAYGEDRADAIRKLREFLEQVRIEGIDTNIPLLVAILADEPFVQGDFDTAYLKSFGQRKHELFDGQTAAAETTAGSSTIQVEGTDELKVLAPSSSILYRAASPSQPDYVKVGDIISADQTLCLLEVMKLFQPLSLSSFNRNGRELYPADQEYQVVHIKGMDGQHVNKGDLLFIVKPVLKVAVAV